MLDPTELVAGGDSGDNVRGKQLYDHQHIPDVLHRSDLHHCSELGILREDCQLHAGQK